MQWLSHDEVTLLLLAHSGACRYKQAGSTCGPVPERYVFQMSCAVQMQMAPSASLKHIQNVSVGLQAQGAGMLVGIAIQPCPDVV